MTIDEIRQEVVKRQSDLVYRVNELQADISRLQNVLNSLDSFYAKCSSAKPSLPKTYCAGKIGGTMREAIMDAFEFIGAGRGMTTTEVMSTMKKRGFKHKRAQTMESRRSSVSSALGALVKSGDLTRRHMATNHHNFIWSLRVSGSKKSGPILPPGLKGPTMNIDDMPY